MGFSFTTSNHGVFELGSSTFDEESTADAGEIARATRFEEDYE